MRVAWCPKHRGVMRISFFDPKPPHFNDPCPRCQGVLVEQIRNKYELTNPGARAENDPLINSEDLVVQENVVQASIPLCTCCEYFKVAPDGFTLCVSCRGCRYNKCILRVSRLLVEAIKEDKYYEEVVPAPIPLCTCCEFFKPLTGTTCPWCDDCPVDHCDVPRKNFSGGLK